MADVRLEWPGKRPPAPVTRAVCLRVTEEYAAAGDGGAWWDRLIHGDCLEVMSALAATETRFRLIYMDPPFFTGKDYVSTNARTGRAEPSTAFTDHWDGDICTYLQWLLDRLTVARSLLAEEGTFYLHLGWQAAALGRLLMDEVFGADRFQNEIAWCYREGINSKTRWNRKHDTILFYSKGERFVFNHEKVLAPYSASTLSKYRHHDANGPYRIMGRGITGSPLASKRDLPASAERTYPQLTFRHYLGMGTLPVDFWNIDVENQASWERTNYPTQKPVALLERMLLASSNPGDSVADFCCGSGTLPVVASRMGRRWVGADSGAFAIHTTRKRLLAETDRAAFTIEQPADACADPQTLDSGAVRIELDGSRFRLRLTPETAATVDMWAVQWHDRPLPAAGQDGAGRYRPDWWSYRDRRRSLASHTPWHHAGMGCGVSGPIASVVLTDAAGCSSSGAVWGPSLAEAWPEARAPG